MFFRKKIRFRFAPSPTGFLHIGNLRSALFSYLLAKSMGGRFILRVEDTDQKREVSGATDKLLDIMDWIGIKFDEGPKVGGQYGPYIQSKRLKTYTKLAQQLLDQGQAYRCFCSTERLTEMRTQQEADRQTVRYDRRCRQLSAAEVDKRLIAGQKFIIRQKMPISGEIVVKDELRGEIKFKASDLDDHVLIKSNGVPTYQFANVVDDHLMKITHVTRGDEWLPSFPKNVLLYQSFNWDLPKFIHLPLILNKEGGKLSKRQGDVFVEDYRHQGYLPEAIVNFSALLGWHSKDDQEIYSLAELEKKFNITGLGTSPAIFDLVKLDYFNAYYIRQKSVTEILELCLPYFKNSGYSIKDQDRLKRFVTISQERMKKLSDVVDLTDFLFTLPDYNLELLNWKELSNEDVKKNLSELKIKLTEIKEENWRTEYLEKTIITWLKDNNKKNGDYLWPLRISLTGLKNSPTPFEVAWALGKDESLVRIERVLKII